MRWLVWKELGQNRPIIVAAGILLIVPHLVVLVHGLLFDEPSTSRMPEAFVFAVAYSILLSQLTLALLHSWAETPLPPSEQIAPPSSCSIYRSLARGSWQPR